MQVVEAVDEAVDAAGRPQRGGALWQPINSLKRERSQSLPLHTAPLPCAASPLVKSRVSGKRPPSQGVPSLPGSRQFHLSTFVVPSGSVSGLAT